jgi:hypothetical protein
MVPLCFGRARSSCRGSARSEPPTAAIAHRAHPRLVTGSRLVQPDVPISGTRLSDQLHGGAHVACLPSCVPVKGDPSVVGVPLIVGTPVWVYRHVGVLGAAEIDGVEGGVMPLRGGSELITGADEFGLKAMNGGLRPPPTSSVEPSGIPAGPTVDPGPMEEASGGDAVADAAQSPGALAAIPPPSKGAVPDVPVTEPPMPADAPVTGLPMLGDVPVVELPMAADGGVDETHGAPSIGEAPDVVGLTPGVASSVAPRGTPVCPTGAFGMPSGDVRPSGGRGEVLRGACA